MKFAKQLLRVCAGVFLMSYAVPALAVPDIYEPFDYDTGNAPGQNGGDGFAGAWVNTRSNPQVLSPGFDWGELQVAGNAVRGNAWSAMQRPIGTTLSDAGLMGNGDALWFSVIFDLTGQNTTNADLNLALGTDTFVSNVFGDRQNLASGTGEGIGVTQFRNNLRGVYWQDNDNDAVAERTESGNALNMGGGTVLVAGKIEWGATDLADELLTLYAPDATLALGTPILNQWQVPALDQSVFDTLALQFKDQSKMDEIRFGATAEDVLPAIQPVIPEPSTLTLAALALLPLGFVGWRRRRR